MARHLRIVLHFAQSTFGTASSKLPKHERLHSQRRTTTPPSGPGLRKLLRTSRKTDVADDAAVASDGIRLYGSRARVPHISVLPRSCPAAQAYCRD